MKKRELNNIFTTKVNEYLAKGYTFHLSSMAGSQGEIGKVDLTNGKEIIRILLTKNTEHSDDYSLYFSNVHTITVGRAIDHTPYETTAWHISNNKLEILEEEKFYPAGPSSDCNHLVTYEEALANQKKHKARHQALRNQEKGLEEVTDSKIIKALIPYIHQIPGCKSVKARHIIEVSKSGSIGEAGYQFIIKKNDKVKVRYLTFNDLQAIREAAH